MVKQSLADDATGHDWWHVDRVRRHALDIQKVEGGDPIVIELAALLHDVSDHKFNGGSYEAGATLVASFLRQRGVKERTISDVSTIIETMSYSAQKGPMHTVEGRIVQDADRLDALGAIGIARCFATSCKLGQPLFNPDQPQGKHAIRHFYEKLLLLKDQMNTETGKKMAETRHEFLRQYLDQFLQEVM